CCQKMCTAQLVTDANMSRILRERGEHEHSALTDRQREVCLVSTTACKRAAAETLDCRPRKIVRREMKNTDHILKPDVKRILKRMSDVKRKSLPTLPKTGEQMLSECETWLADGTFEFAPDKFTHTVKKLLLINSKMQLYSIHGHNKGHNVRLAYACLPDKKGPTYVALFEYLKSLARERVGEELRPAHFLEDFEDATLSAIRECFPGADIRACRFHFTQNCIKRIRAHKSLLSRNRLADSETGKWLRAFNGLPCLPPAMVPDAFAELIGCAPESTNFILELERA
ncbi:Angiotensin-converting enzyme-like protein Ace3, partial [Frankliniella fusca]